MKTLRMMLLVLIMAVLVVLPVMAGGAKEKAGAEKKYSFYLFEVGFWHPYFIAHIHGAQEAATKYPIDLVVVDGRNDPGFQANQVIQAIAKKPDMILINCVTEQGLVPALREAQKAGIPVFTTDRDVADFSLRLGHVGSSQVEIGNQAGQYAVDYLRKSGLPKPWKVVVLQGLVGNIGNTERVKGWYDKLNPLINSGEIEVVAEEAADFAREVAITKMQQILVKTRDFDLLLAGNDAEAVGAIIAMEATGLKPGQDVQIIGVDADPDGLQAIKDGKMLATVAHQAWLQGYWAVEMGWKYLQEGKKPPADKWPNSDLITNTFIVDKTNVAKTGPFGEPLRSSPTEPVSAPPLPY